MSFHFSLAVIVLLWQYKQKEKPKAWTTLLQVLVSALIGGVMIIIILAIVKTKDAVSFFDNFEKNLRTDSSDKSKRFIEKVESDNCSSCYKMEESYYWQQYIKFFDYLQQLKVNISFINVTYGKCCLPKLPVHFLLLLIATRIGCMMVICFIKLLGYYL